MKNLNKFGHENPFVPHFHPLGFEEGFHVLEKEEGDGKKRKYLRGFSSGTKIDAHGERMTENAIKCFMEQANSGDILLYSDIHGIKSSKDIGKLVECKITPTGDWETLYKLYDEDDFDRELHKDKFATIDSIWKQLNGLPPYRKKIQKGFSVEGHIPDNGIIEQSVTGQRVIDNVELDGVVLVPRPAYKTGIAHAIYKSLGEMPNWSKINVRETIQQKLDSILQKSIKPINKQYQMELTLSETIERIMKSRRGYKKQILNIVFKEYTDKIIDIIMQSEKHYKKGNKDFSNKSDIHRIYKNLKDKMELLKVEIYKIRGEKE